ncbi:MAG: tRNA-dihydrouridine synthase [Patescibacteria group bacterium]|nr:tRNA-dihydrouridine synthase [Patescibacteria group bacterium]
MNKNFWEKLDKPIYALAPMAGVADSAFRQICKNFGADVVYSEMASATALVYNPAKTLELLKFNKKERPCVVQLFGSKPGHFEAAVKFVEKKIKPDGIDINFGCPVKKVARQGAGAILMDDKKLAREIIKNVINNTGLPVSIKIRSKAGNTSALEFLDYIKDLDIKTVMIHGRTMAQSFSGPVDVSVIKKARDYFGGIILANGGAADYESAVKLLDRSGADGIGIARGALGRPWIFKAVRTGQNVQRSPRAIYKVAFKHVELAYKLKGDQGIIETRKHLCWYVQGLPGAKKMRESMVKINNLVDIREIIKTRF